MFRNNLYVFLFFAGLALILVSLYTLHTRLPDGHLKISNTEVYSSLIFGTLMVIIGSGAWYFKTYKIHRHIKLLSRELAERSNLS